MPELNHHKINYVEFATKNLSASKLFFHAAFNWQFKDYGPEYSAPQNLPRLQEIKTKYDPNNMFWFEQSLGPKPEGKHDFGSAEETSEKKEPV